MLSILKSLVGTAMLVVSIGLFAMLFLVIFIVQLILFFIS